MNSNDTPGPDPAHDINPASVAAPGRHWPARIVILIAFIYFALTVSLLYWRWLAVREPSSVILFEGTRQLAGARITVTSVPPAISHSATLTAADRYRVPFYLDRGNYEIIVAHHDQILFQTEILVGRNEGRRIDLSGLVAEQRPDRDPR